MPPYEFNEDTAHSAGVCLRVNHVACELGARLGWGSQLMHDACRLTGLQASLVHTTYLNQSKASEKQQLDLTTSYLETPRVQLSPVYVLVAHMGAYGGAPQPVRVCV